VPLCALCSGYGKHKDLGKLSQDDLERAIKKLKILGKGFEIIVIGDRKLVQSVPTELNQDHAEIMKSVAANGCTSVARLRADVGWSEARAQKGLVRTFCVRVLLIPLISLVLVGRGVHWQPGSGATGTALHTIHDGRTLAGVPTIGLSRASIRMLPLAIPCLTVVATRWGLQDQMLQEGMAWVDTQADNGAEYYLPGMHATAA
jgi:hypothetical protein